MTQSCDQMDQLSDHMLASLEESVYTLYENFSSGLPFHGWQHVEFVRERAVGNATRNGADTQLVRAAALLHDLNYMVRRNSSTTTGTDIRRELLRAAGAPDDVVAQVENVIQQAETERRGPQASLEAQALSDADTLYKALPITPVLLAHRYMDETGQNLRQLCDRIVRDQVRLNDEGIYFYDAANRRQYQEWTDANLRLWQCIDDALELPEVRELVKTLENVTDDGA